MRDNFSDERGSDAAATRLPPELRGLFAPAAYAHAVHDVRLVETHISWVLLTGDYAYKIKKPVNLGFLDFSTLDARRRACAEELRLNRRFAPQLYVGVVPIVDTAQGARVEGSGIAIEYAVKMRQFAQEQQLDRLLAAGELCMGDMDALGVAVAELHRAAPAATAAVPLGWPEQIAQDAQDNIDVLRDAPDAVIRAAVQALDRWSGELATRLAPLMRERRQQGFVREVHGDLHLSNLVRLDGAIVPFDCIEFSAALRFNDTISDLAFLTMDLRARGRVDLAARLLNAYLEQAGDYAGVRLLRYYEVYRALVRAKVACIRQREAAGADRIEASRQLEAYVAFARDRALAPHPALVLMHGLSGSGKTRFSARLMSVLPAVRVRSDVERKRLHNLGADARSGSPVAGGIYAAAASEQTYAHLQAAAAACLEGGEVAIVDAAFLRRADRARFRALAQAHAVPFRIVSCSAPVAQLQRRIEQRAVRGGDASEADAAVLAHQLESAQPLGEDERTDAIEVATDDAASVERALAQVCAGLTTAASAGGVPPSA